VVGLTTLSEIFSMAVAALVVGLCLALVVFLAVARVGIELRSISERRPWPKVSRLVLQPLLRRRGAF
jgi:uncharacterized protein HemY